ncbi:MAG TPA: radical SAM protein [Bacilli bacterium]|jgi:predicted Fe-S oxidoreductase|nr:radical SAM protein [Bacilli bacterium]
MVKKFVLQWHLSENCNLKCLHCYQENHKPIQLSYEQLEKIYKQYKNLLKKLKMKGHINITGGEPLCNPHLFKILDLIKKNEELISFSILTNGTLITKNIAKKIKSYNPYYVQVSLEGGQKTNDYIRGKGTYKKIAKGIKNLKKYNIFTSISFTATTLNYKEFPKVVSYAKKYKVDNVWSDRYIPLGDSEDKNLALNVSQTQEYLSIMAKERLKLKRKQYNKTTISMYRALQFQKTNDFAYGCTAGDTLLTVMENGDLVPCRRMPIVVGNLLKDDMYKLYKTNSILKKLRKNTIPDDCNDCEHAQMCHGGLKCLTYAIYKDLNHKDIGCNL